MFTGIIQSLGSIGAIQPKGGDVRLHVKTGDLPMHNVELGDSIATNGVCLTVVEMNDHSFWADVSNETLDTSTLAHWKVGDAVNLEKAMTPETHFGGHIVSGHVDGVGEVISRRSEGRSERIVFKAPNELAKYIAHKGSITVDGISLTVNHVNGAEFGLNIVPHTLVNTVLDTYQAGRKVNLEVDVVARYLERLLLGDKAHEPNASDASYESGVSATTLIKSGFMKP